MHVELHNHLPGLSDTHCHLSFPPLIKNIDAVLDRAIQAGLQYLLTIGQGLQDSAQALQLARRYPQVHAAVGFGPHAAQKFSDQQLQQLADLASAGEVLAIGETGLDYYHDRPPKDLQKTLFAQQANLAAHLQLPLIVHCRDAWDDCLAILDEITFDSPPGLFHCYTGPVQLVPELIDRGFYISFAGMITFSNADAYHTAAKKVPLDRLLIETDAPYLSPEPLRRIKPNEPAFLVHTARFLARMLDICPTELAHLTTKNARDLFALTPSGR